VEKRRGRGRKSWGEGDGKAYVLAVWAEELDPELEGLLQEGDCLVGLILRGVGRGVAMSVSCARDWEGQGMASGEPLRGWRVPGEDGGDGIVRGCGWEQVCEWFWRESR
jgi:hypothetical protein